MKPQAKCRQTLMSKMPMLSKALNGRLSVMTHILARELKLCKPIDLKATPSSTRKATGTLKEAWSL